MSSTTAAVLLVKAMFEATTRPVMVPELQIQLYQLDQPNETFEELRRGGSPALFLALRKAFAEGYLDRITGVDGGYTLAASAGDRIDALAADDPTLHEELARAAEVVAEAA